MSNVDPPSRTVLERVQFWVVALLIISGALKVEALDDESEQP